MEINNIEDRKAACTMILNAPDGEYVFELRRRRNPRTVDQNGLYWMWLTAAQQETGNSKDDLHRRMKEMFNNGNSTTGLELPKT